MTVTQQARKGSPVPPRMRAWRGDGSACPPPSFDPQERPTWLIWDAPTPGSLSPSERDLASAMDAGIIAYGVSVSGNILGVAVDGGGVVLVGRVCFQDGRVSEWLTSRNPDDHWLLGRVLALAKWPTSIPPTSSPRCIAQLLRNGQEQGSRPYRWLETLIAKTVDAVAA